MVRPTVKLQVKTTKAKDYTQSRIHVKSYPGFRTDKSYPVLEGVNHIIPADRQVVPMTVNLVSAQASAKWHPSVPAP